MIILDILMVWWVYWPMSILLLSCGYALGHQEDEFHPEALIFLGALLAGILYRFDNLRHFLLSWDGALLGAGGYLMIGAAISLCKWMQKLDGFKTFAKDWLPKNKPDPRNFTPPQKERLERAWTDTYATGRVTEQDGVFFLNWRKFPLATWWIYWPFFSFSVILDPIRDLVNTIIAWFGNRLEQLAKIFSVKA